MSKLNLEMITEEALINTEATLAVSGMSDDIQSMIDKISNIKYKDLATIVKKIKYDGNIEEGTRFESKIGEQLDQLLASMSEVKSSIDNIVVGLFGNDEDSDLDMDLDTDEEEVSDFEKDLGEPEEALEDDEGEFSDAFQSLNVRERK